MRETRLFKSCFLVYAYLTRMMCETCQVGVDEESHEVSERGKRVNGVYTEREREGEREWRYVMEP